MAEKRKPGRPRKKHAGGRPTVMTAETLQKLEYGFARSLTDTECCDFAGITPSTLYNYCNKNPEFSEKKELLKHRPKINAKFNVADAIENGDVDLSKWYLERKAKDEFSTKQDIAVSGSVNNPMADLTTEELKKLIDSE